MLETGKETFTEVQTPSGIEIRYHWEPERKYELRASLEKAFHPYVPSDGSKSEWKEVPSVTTVLDILHKPGLPWWGMEIGVKGMQQLRHYPGLTIEALMEADSKDILKHMTKHKLTVNHVRDEAGKRGHSVHGAMEAWAENGVAPDPTIYQSEERGYIEGIVHFIEHIGDKVEVLSIETIVGSIQHGFAGRYDLRVRITEPVDVAYKWTPVRGPKFATLQPGEYLIDLKTSKRVYSSHHRQLAAYELASVECGYDATDAQGILHVMDYGGYEFVRSVAEGEDFLVSLSLWKSEVKLREGSKK